jgi:hypothetical protein
MAKTDAQKLSADVIVLLVNGASDEAIISHCQSTGLTARQASKMVSSARERIAIAARYDPRQELGAAIKRLNSLYSKSIKAEELGIALQAQRELNRLLRLGDLPSGEEGDGEQTGDLDRQVNAVKQHLLPLKLTEESKPIEEHARLAAERIRSSQKI